MLLWMMVIFIALIRLFNHIVGAMLVDIQMHHRLLFCTFGEELLDQGLKCPNYRMLQGYCQIAFPLCLFGGEVGY